MTASPVLYFRSYQSGFCNLIFFRLGSRSTWGAFARSEAEFEEIVDNLNELEVRYCFLLFT